MFYNMMTLSAVSFSPIVGGYITEKHGWRTQFYIIAGFLFMGIILLFLACPEHAYTRPASCNTDLATQLRIDDSMEHRTPSAVNDSSGEKPESYAQQLRACSMNVAERSIIVLLARPLVCMIYPVVLWAFFLGGCWSTWVCRPRSAY